MSTEVSVTTCPICRGDGKAHGVERFVATFCWSCKGGGVLTAEKLCELFSGADVHELIAWMEPFEAIRSGHRKFEFRDSMDYDFKVGDLLHLREYDPKSRAYSERHLYTRITYVLKVFSTYAILSIDAVSEGKA